MMENLPITIDAIPDGNDPFLLGVKWFGLVVAALLVGAAPVMIYLRKYHIDHVANSRDAASAEVYETLRQQIRDHGAQLHQYADDLAKQQSATFSLRSKLAEYEANDLIIQQIKGCLLYTSDAADERSSVDLGGRRIIKKKNNHGPCRTRCVTAQ